MVYSGELFGGGFRSLADDAELGVGLFFAVNDPVSGCPDQGIFILGRLPSSALKA